MKTNKPPGIDHFCVGVDNYDATRVAGAIGALGIETRRVDSLNGVKFKEGQIYVTDPDGDTFEVTAVGNPGVSGATAVLTSTFIFYTPDPTNSTQSDSFTYTVSDSFGATVEGWLQIAQT